MCTLDVLPVPTPHCNGYANWVRSIEQQPPPQLEIEQLESLMQITAVRPARTGGVATTVHYRGTSVWGVGGEGGAHQCLLVLLSLSEGNLSLGEQQRVGMVSWHLGTILIRL